MYYIDLKNNNIPYTKYRKILTNIMVDRCYKNKIRVMLISKMIL